MTSMVRSPGRLLLLLVLIFLGLSSASAAPSPRVRYSINDAWLFSEGPVEGAEKEVFDDSGWSRIDLPHTWNAEDAFDDRPGYRRGTGWYRRNLILDEALREKRIHLHFEGANQVAEVWLNGRKAGSHVGGYTAFLFDITALVRWDGSNSIAVRVDNAHDEDIPPLNADFTFFGGIYRDVWLVATSPVRLTLTDHASSGIFIDSTPRGDRAEVVLRGSVDNSLPRMIRARMEHRIFDERGNEITRATAAIELPANGSAAFRHESVSIPSPKLWSPSDPHLYRVVTEIVHEGRLVDRIVNSFGVRSFRADPARGFLLNGQPLRLNGTNRHQDRAGYGNALPDALHRRDVEIIKDDGFNFLRLAHYPQDPAILEAADHLGLVVWEEIPIVNLIGMSDAFAENSERMLVEMIRQHYNHPSIVFWGYMNEVMLTRPNPIPEGYYQRMLELTRRLEARVKAEDPGRLTVMALSRDEIPPEDHGLGSVTDVLAFNLYFGWYYEKLETLGAFLDEFHRAHPSRPLIVSEYGAGSDERVHATAPTPFDFSSEYAQIFHGSSFSQMEERGYLVGTAIWNHFDFASEARSDSKPTLNQKGLYFHDRTPKDTAFYYRAALLEEPVLYIGREWLRRAGSLPAERIQPVWAYTNLDEVILFINGVTAGPVPIENRRAVTKALLVDGPNRIRASGRRGEQWFTDEITIDFDDRSEARRDGLIAVNAGSEYSYVDDAGVVWEADREWRSGGWGFVGGAPGRTHHRISSTDDDPLLQPSRVGMDAYRFDLPDGMYEVEIALAERDRQIAAGSRIFSVIANGAAIFTDLDLVASAGPFAAVRRKAVVEAVNGEGIEIRFPASAGKPVVSAILIRR